MKQPKVTNTHQLATQLRLLAKELDDRPPLDVNPDHVAGTRITVRYWATKEHMIAFARAMGDVRKDVRDGDYHLLFGSGAILLQCHARQSDLCRLVKQAQKAVYECEPLLSREEEQAIGVES